MSSLDGAAVISNLHGPWIWPIRTDAYLLNPKDSVKYQQAAEERRSPTEKRIGYC